MKYVLQYLNSCNMHFVISLFDIVSIYLILLMSSNEADLTRLLFMYYTCSTLIFREHFMSYSQR